MLSDVVRLRKAGFLPAYEARMYHRLYIDFKTGMKPIINERVTG